MHDDLQVVAAVAAPLAAARAGAARFTALSVEHERTGRLSAEALAALEAAGLFGIMVPRELGGLEASPRDMLETFEEVSRADGATGWVLTTCAFAAGLAGAFMSDSAAAEVFGHGMPIIAGAGAPNGRARRVDRGYELSGRWSYGSGILHATHTHNGAMIVDPRGEVSRELGPHIFVTPIAAARLDDEWNVLGLRGTGSVDYSIDRCVLPLGYEHPIGITAPQRGGGMYSTGLAGLSAIAHTGFFLGIGRRVLDELAQVACSKAGRAGALSESESFQEGYGMLEAHLRSARALVFESWRTIEQRLARALPIDRAQIMDASLAMYHSAWASTEAAEYAYKAAGGVSLRDGPLQRAFRDALSGRQHMRVSSALLRACARDLLTRSRPQA